ncbi:hypothetical protein [Nocardia blacklockiae]|uniref:hypothetical protein n=1 Tax=Nocardia blacklockiae TaxID=480036 RepID=UPI001893BC40|nr:hypothetical protein [Nocardia blacklockiae]MBF6171528.1 hypothetical protein [Nocardia blacklockiae]
MGVEQLAEWATVTLAVSWLVLVAGFGVGKVLALMERVDMLEHWAGRVEDEFLTRQQPLGMVPMGLGRDPGASDRSDVA